MGREVGGDTGVYRTLRPEHFILHSYKPPHSLSNTKSISKLLHLHKCIIFAFPDARNALQLAQIQAGFLLNPLFVYLSQLFLFSVDISSRSIISA